LTSWQHCGRWLGIHCSVGPTREVVLEHTHTHTL